MHALYFYLATRSAFLPIVFAFLFCYNVFNSNSRYHIIICLQITATLLTTSQKYRVLIANCWDGSHHRGSNALTANPRALQSHLSYPACITSGNFIPVFPRINSRSRLFSRWRMRVRHRREVCGADDKFGCRACVNVMHDGQER